MLVIWGFRWLKRVVDQVGPYNCDRCQYFGMWTAIRMSRFFTLFFIPVIPIRREYSLICPVCSRQAVIDKAQYDQLVATAPPPASSFESL